MNEELLYDLASTIVRTIEDKQQLERENKYLRKQLDMCDEHTRNQIKRNEKLVGDIFIGLLKNIK